MSRGASAAPRRAPLQIRSSENTQGLRGLGGGPDSSPRFWVINVASAQGPRGLFKNRARLGWTHFFAPSRLLVSQLIRGAEQSRSLTGARLSPSCSQIQDTSYFLLEKKKRGRIPLQFCSCGSEISLRTPKRAALREASDSHNGVVDIKTI